VQEQDLIDFVVEHISSHGSAESLAKELEMVFSIHNSKLTGRHWTRKLRCL